MRNPLLLLAAALQLATPLTAHSRAMMAPSIYGDDDRTQISDVTDSRVTNLSHAVVLITSDDYIEPITDQPGQFQPKFMNFDLPLDGLLASDHRRFSNESSGGFCTGFLIDSKHVMTAGHCIDEDSSCDNLRFVFDYTTDATTNRVKPIILEKNIKKCSKILGVSQTTSRHADYAIVELAEEIKDRPSFHLTNAIENPKAGTKIGMLGHPSGKPMKFTGIADVLQDHSESETQFITNLDAFHGNSGSPVFDIDTLDIVGILVAGADDDETKPDGSIEDRRYALIPTFDEINNRNEMHGERVTSIAVLQGEIKNVLAGLGVPPIKPPLVIPSPGVMPPPVILQNASTQNEPVLGPFLTERTSPFGN